MDAFDQLIVHTFIKLIYMMPYANVIVLGAPVGYYAYQLLFLIGAGELVKYLFREKVKK